MKDGDKMCDWDLIQSHTRLLCVLARGILGPSEGAERMLPGEPWDCVS